MAATFGELVYESSRAFADDEDEEFQGQASLSFEVEHTSAGKDLIDANIEPSDLVFSAFVGKVAVGFGSCLMRDERDFNLLAEVFMVGQGENVVDMYLNRPKKKAVAHLYQGRSDKNILLALFNTHGVPRYMANDIVESIVSYIKVSKRVLVFHSDTMAYYQSEDNSLGKVYFVKSSQFPVTDELPNSCVPLPPPNVIGGVSAAVLMHGEMYDKPGVLLASYGETELVDSISIKPFLNAVQHKSSSLSKIFSSFELSDELALKSNLSTVEISNLYV